MNPVAMPSANVPSMRERVTDAEWVARIQLAALYRIAAYMGLE
ncbi:MAG: class II aldolase, partial [Alphaproteobacteria bacterium]|nr:class II aldolase [Alphaproteobacteria bacterium]